MSSDPEASRARDLLRQARAVTVLTGAGISTDSGIQDFRGPNGLWTKNPQAEKTAHLSYYLSDPEVRRRAWRNRLESGYFEAEPNAGHRALLALEEQGKLHTLVTQNVDGLHLDAGTDPAKVVQIHGTVRRWACLDCGLSGPMAEALERVRNGEEDPDCRNCGGIVKSATISFGQNLVPEDLLRAEQAAQACDLLLCIGTSLGVYPAAGMVPIAKQSGARLVIVNAQETPFDRVADAVVRVSISEVVPYLLS